jgi:hypothetical protein
MGYYLSEGLFDGKKDLVQANLLFKEAADDGLQMLNYIMHFLYLIHQELNLIAKFLIHTLQRQQMVVMLQPNII